MRPRRTSFLNGISGRSTRSCAPSPSTSFHHPGEADGRAGDVRAILLLFFLPWLDTSPVRSGNYRPLFRKFFWILDLDVLVLGYCGGAPAEEPFVMISQVAAAYYFAHFLIILPIIAAFEKPLPLPGSITEAVLAKHGEAAE
jgi:ubiquinol-cytochrome c reductase cytochrome b subunit